MNTPKNIFLTVFILLNTNQVANAGLGNWQKLRVTITPVLALCLYYVFKPFIPNRIIGDISTYVDIHKKRPELPPFDSTTLVQGGWRAICNDGFDREIAIDCRDSKSDSCSVYFNCKACLQHDNEMYKGQSKRKLGQISLQKKNECNQYYEGIIYDHNDYFNGKLTGRRVLMVTHDRTQMRVSYLDKNGAQATHDIWVRSPNSEWDVLPSTPYCSK